jgi:uncharacterized protein YciI
MNYYALIYETIDTYLEERSKYRTEHLALATQYFDEGKLLLAGAMDDPADEALLIFKGENEVPATSFAQNDPYVKNGLIKRWRVRKWNVVVGREE